MEKYFADLGSKHSGSICPRKNSFPAEKWFSSSSLALAVIIALWRIMPNIINQCKWQKSSFSFPPSSSRLYRRLIPTPKKLLIYLFMHSPKSRKCQSGFRLPPSTFRGSGIRISEESLTKAQSKIYAHKREFCFFFAELRCLIRVFSSQPASSAPRAIKKNQGGNCVKVQNASSFCNNARRCYQLKDLLLQKRRGLFWMQLGPFLPLLWMYFCFIHSPTILWKKKFLFAGVKEWKRGRRFDFFKCPYVRLFPFKH